MALQKTQLNVKFQGGIETKIDAKTVPSARLLVLENAVFTKAISLVKRSGYTSLGRGIDGGFSTLSGAKRLAHRDDELLSLTPNRCYSYQATADQWTDSGAVFSVAATDRPAVRTGTQQTMGDHASNNGVTVYAWEDSRGGVWWSATDTLTGSIYRLPAQLHASGERPRCVAVGALIHVYYAVSSLRSIYVAVINPSTPTAAVASVQLVDDLLTSNPVYDAVPTDRPGTPALIAWAEFGTTNVRIGFVDSSGALGSPVTGHPSAFREATPLVAASPISVAYNADRAGQQDELAVSYVTTTSRDLLVSYYTTSATAFTRTAQVTPYAATVAVTRIATTFANDLTLYWAAEEDNAAPSKRFVKHGSETFVGVSTTVTTRSVGLASRAWTYSGDAFAVFVHDTTYFNTYVSLRLSDAFPVGRHLPGQASGAPAQTHLPSVHASLSDDTKFSMCLPYRERLESENDDKFTETGLRLVDLDFDDSNSHETAQLGRGLYLGGACPMHYDGSAWTEQSFHVGPELISTASAGGGSMTSVLEYEYVCWYEWTDALGEVHRSGTSIPSVITMGASDTQVTLTLPTLRLTKKTGVRICVARSKANDSSAFYRVTSSDPNTEGTPNGYVSNSTSTDTATLIDRMSDATLITEEPLYTNGGILSNDPAPLSGHIVTGKSRLFATDPGDPLLVRYSKQIVDGEGLAIAPELQIKCDPFGGAITALAVMDEQLIIFKESALFLVGGDGPLDNGDSSQTGFTNPQMITSDVGCVDPASIVLMPTGLMFKSAKGIYLLDRGKSVTYVGSPVEAYNTQDVRRATMMQDRTQVVFLTSSGKTLLFDYLFSQWSTFTNHEGYDACLVGGSYHYMRTDGRIFKEAPGSYSDDGRAIVMRFETAWVHFHEHLQGFQRFYHLHLLGERKSPHQFKIQYRTNYKPHWSDPVYLDATDATVATGWVSGWDAGWTIGSGEEPMAGTVYGDGNYGDGPYGGNPPDVYQWRMHLGAKGQSISFRFEDFEQAGETGASFELSEMLITGGSKGPAYKPFSASRSA